jgi:hypothetical protein
MNDDEITRFFAGEYVLDFDKITNSKSKDIAEKFVNEILNYFDSMLDDNYKGGQNFIKVRFAINTLYYNGFIVHTRSKKIDNVLDE